MSTTPGDRDDEPEPPTSVFEAGANVFVKPEHYIATMEAIGAVGSIHGVLEEAQSLFPYFGF